jgi:hypothetical protein
MKKKPTFRSRLEGLTAEQIHAGAPALAILVALIEEVRRVGFIAAAAHDLDKADLFRAQQREARTRARGTRMRNGAEHGMMSWPIVVRNAASSVTAEVTSTTLSSSTPTLKPSVNTATTATTVR